MEKTVATHHIFKDLPLLQPFVPYETKGCHAAKMKLPRESCPISKTDVFTRQRLWLAWNKICNSWLSAFDFQDQDPPACRAGLSRRNDLPRRGKHTRCDCVHQDEGIIESDRRRI
jgi:hypothetical protein